MCCWDSTLLNCWCVGVGKCCCWVLVVRNGYFTWLIASFSSCCTVGVGKHCCWVLLLYIGVLPYLTCLFFTFSMCPLRIFSHGVGDWCWVPVLLVG
uniref:Uncharacterized protein n=1 Tax=Kalanchoe fedtschenkoi TaxID=63787 RepID=A0A7N0VHR4_KALFE